MSDSSSAPEVAASEVVEDVNTEVAASSSTADEKDVKAPETLLDAVRKATEAEKAPVEKVEGEDSSDPEGKTGNADSKDGQSAEAKAEEDKEPPFAKHPRWQEMLHTNRTLDARVKELAPVVEQFEAFRGHVRSSGLSSEEIDQGFAIMTAMKKDQSKALELLKPHLNGLQLFVGETLPEDLQAKVTSGVLDESSAKEIALLRNKSAHQGTITAQEAERQRADAEARQQQDAHQQRVNFGNACAVAVQAEEALWKKSDPDYSKKQHLIDREVAALLAEKGDKITTEKQAVALAREAKENVEKTIRGFIPPGGAKRMVVGGGSSAPKSAQPNTLLEVVRAAAAQ